MKKLPLIFIFLSFLFIAKSQTNMDSLWGVWNDENQKDTCRLKAIGEISYAYLESNPDSALHFAEIGYDYAEKCGSKKYMAHALNQKGRSYQANKEYNKAEKLFLEASEIFENINYKKGVGSSMSYIANNYYMQKKYTEAIMYLEKDRMIMKELRDSIGELGTLVNIAVLYRVQKKYDDALIVFQECLELSTNLNNIQKMANAHYNIGVVHGKKANHDTAVDHYLISIEYYQKARDTTSIIQLMINLHSAYSKLGKYRDGLHVLDRAKIFYLGLNDSLGLVKNLNSRALIYGNLGDYVKALEYYEQGLTILEKFKDEAWMGAILNNIAKIYLDQEEYGKAKNYFRKALNIHLKNDKKRWASNSLNALGSVSINEENYEEAIEYINRSLEISQEIEFKYGIATSFSLLGTINSSKKQYQKALEFYLQSLQIRKEINNYSSIATSLLKVGHLYELTERYNLSITNCKEALAIANQIEAIDKQKEACECLYKSYKAIGNDKEALIYFEKAGEYRNKLKSEETAKKLQQMEFAKEMLADSLLMVEERMKVEYKLEISEQKKKRNQYIYGGSGLLVLLLAFGGIRRFIYVRKSKAVIEKERDRSDHLLLNILPSEIAEELKTKGKAKARDFEQVSILFTDFVEFTKTSAGLSAQELVEEINTCYEAFDHIIEKHGVEKIKTIGDSYMAAGGLPVPNADSVINTIKAALEMQDWIKARKDERTKQNLPAFEMRCGIHTGPVVAGIVGVKKFQYDVWGDTVNAASRMESEGAVGKVNISKATFELIKDQSEFEFENRGKIEVKGKGDMEMLFVQKKIKYHK